MPGLRADRLPARRALHALRDRARLPGDGEEIIPPELPAHRLSRGRRHTGIPTGTIGVSEPPRAARRIPAPPQRAREGGEHDDARSRCRSWSASRPRASSIVFGIPGGANLPTYDALYDAGIRHIQVRHEQGGGHAAEGYAKATGKVGVALRAPPGPGATNLVTRDRRRDDGLGPDRVHHRPGAHRPDRHRRLPGGRRHRHHDAGRQALASWSPTRARSREYDPRGLPHRLAPAARARCWSTSRRTSRGPTSTTSRSRDVAPARLPADDRGQHQADPASPPRRSPTRSRPVLYVGGGVDQRQRLRGAARALRRRPLPGHLHADGPRRLPGARTSSGSACSACTAPAPPTTRWTRPT